MAASGPDVAQYIYVLAMLVLVLGVILVLARLLRWQQSRNAAGPGLLRRARARERRLSLVEIVPVDPKRRLVLVKRDDVLHLLLIGGGNDLLIETVPVMEQLLPAASSNTVEDSGRSPS